MHLLQMRIIIKVIEYGRATIFKSCIFSYKHDSIHEFVGYVPSHCRSVHMCDSLLSLASRVKVSYESTAWVLPWALSVNQMHVRTALLTLSSGPSHGTVKFYKLKLSNCQT